MKIVGIICEYNPFHLGHWKQIQWIRAQLGGDCAVVCLMSGNYVQRGHPAIIDKSLRAEAALACGADLVLELPVTCALSSAEGFAAGGVEILSRMCTHLCFGTEIGDPQALMDTAGGLLSPEFAPILRKYLAQGVSFPAARAAALEELGVDAGLLASPNDILAVEYCKAILRQNSRMQLLPIRREGDYHDLLPDRENPSATAIRRMMTAGENWRPYAPEVAAKVLSGGAIHTLQAGQSAMLMRLRTMTDEEFETLPYGSEGLWRKLMHASRREPDLEAVLTATKSKRYTRSRLDRMVMCALLGITNMMMQQIPPYIRILGFRDRGRQVLRIARRNGTFLNAGEAPQDAYWQLEKRCGDLYGLFCAQGPEAPGREEKRRVIYIPEE